VHRQQTIVVIPCYNEALRLDPLSMIEFVNANGHCHLLFVDDGSKDGTGDRLRFLASNSQQIEMISLPVNVGKAEAVRQGMLAAMRNEPRFVAYWDADLATPLDDVLRFENCLIHSEDIHMVLGCRIKLQGHDVKRRLTRSLLGRVFSVAASAVLGVRLRDTQCGAKMFRASPLIESVFSEPFISRWIFDVEVIARVRSHLSGQSNGLLEIPVQQWSEVEGSKLRTRDFLAATSELIRIGWQQQQSQANASQVELKLPNKVKLSRRKVA